MNFKFQLIGDTKLLCGRVDVLRFERAQGMDIQARINKTWLREMNEMFAFKSELTCAQTWQLIISGEFNRARAMHARMAAKVPTTIIGVDEKGAPVTKENPIYTRLNGLQNMKQEDHSAFIRNSFVFSLSLRHPDERVAMAKPNKEVSSKILKRELTHPSDLRSAHVQRTQKALQAFNDVWGKDYISQDHLTKLGDELGLNKF